jgi:hypothetical protein
VLFAGRNLAGAAYLSDGISGFLISGQQVGFVSLKPAVVTEASLSVAGAVALLPASSIVSF